MIETKKASEKAYRVYDYLCKNCVGRENREGCEQVARAFGMSRRMLREVIFEINTYMDFDKIVCRDVGLYIAADKAEAERYINTATNRWKSICLEAQHLTDKCKLAGQGKIPFGKYYKESRETFSKKI